MRSKSGCATTAWAFPPNIERSCSNPSSPPRRPARAQGLACQSATISQRNSMAVRSRSRARSATSPSSRCGCRRVGSRPRVGQRQRLDQRLGTRRPRSHPRTATGSAWPRAKGMRPWCRPCYLDAASPEHTDLARSHKGFCALSPRHWGELSDSSAPLRLEQIGSQPMQLSPVASLLGRPRLSMQPLRGPSSG